MKTDLRYAESTSRSDDGKLQLLGWGAPRSRTATSLPGQVRTLEVIREGKGWVFLDWKEPVDGGQVAAYKVQRRKRDSGDWSDVGMAVESEITLNDQEPGVEFEYRVTAVNKAGQGPASQRTAKPFTLHHPLRAPKGVRRGSRVRAFDRSAIFYYSPAFFWLPQFPLPAATCGRPAAQPLVSPRRSSQSRQRARVGSGCGGIGRRGPLAMDWARARGSAAAETRLRRSSPCFATSLPTRTLAIDRSARPSRY